MMGWSDLEPIVKTVPRVQACIRVQKDKQPRFWLFLSETMLKEMNKPVTVNVAVGIFDGVAKLRLTPDKKGKFPVNGMGRGGARVIGIPCRPPCPDGARETETCQIEKEDDLSVIVVLPLEAWARQVNVPPKRVGADVKKAAAVEPEPRTATPANKLNVVEYLTSKGFTIRRDGDGFFVNGRKHSRMDALKLVNDQRRIAQLPPISILEIH